MMDGCVYFPGENNTVVAPTQGGTLNNSLQYKFCQTERRVALFSLRSVQLWEKRERKRKEKKKHPNFETNLRAVE